jgi:hypothetical protein
VGFKSIVYFSRIYYLVGSALMQRTCLPIVIGFCLLAILTPTHTVAASAPPIQYTVGVGSGTVSVSVNLNMIQNATAFERSFVLPRFHVLATGANASGLTQIVQDSLRVKNTKASVSSMNLEIASSAWYNVTTIQWLNESLSFDVSGVTVSQGSLVQADVSWKSFSVSSGYAVGGVEVNRIGERYFTAVAADLAAVSNSQSQFIHQFYQVNGRSYNPGQFPAAVGNVTVLDFSSFATPISEWQSHASLIGSQSWSFKGAGNLGLDFIEQVQEPGSAAASTANYGLFYSLNGVITASSRARASGDTVVLVVSEFPEVVMGGVILSVVGLWSASSLLERRVQAKMPRKKAKR